MFTRLSYRVMEEAWWELFPTDSDSIKSLVWLLQPYRSNTRWYHDTEHIADCLNKLEDFRHDLCTSPLDKKEREMLTLAILYHDIVYTPGRKDNEENSAKELLRSLHNNVNLTPGVLDAAAELILDTKEGAEPTSFLGKLLHDIDNSILGSPLHIYDGYSAAVWQEFSPYFDTRIFQRGRAEFLSKILEKRTPIFLTRHFSGLEGQARANIRRELRRLTT